MTAPLIPDNPLLTTGEAAKLLGVTLRTVQLWATAGTLACIVTLGGHRRIRQSEVQRLQQAMAFKPPADAVPALSKEEHKIATLQGQLDAARAALKAIATDTRFVPNYYGQHEFTAQVARTTLAAILAR